MNAAFFLVPSFLPSISGNPTRAAALDKEKEDEKERDYPLVNGAT